MPPETDLSNVAAAEVEPAEGIITDRKRHRGRSRDEPRESKFEELLAVQGHPIFKTYQDFLKDRAVALAERELQRFKDDRIAKEFGKQKTV